jgi:hypothetical protein
VVGSYRERKVQLSLADERLEVLIPEGVGLPIHQFCQAAEGDESSFAKVQDDIDQYLAIHLLLVRGSDGIGSKRERKASEAASLRVV